jgi:dTDP-4-amino-4,6-dideoxygalactose transaminase
MGVNSRLDEIQAAILGAKLPSLRRWTDARRAVASRYRRLLASAPVEVPKECDPGHVYHLFPVRSPHRDRLQSYLREQGVETLIHYPVAIPDQPALRTESPAACPAASRACAEVLSLPIFPSMSDEEVAVVAAAVGRFTA